MEHTRYECDICFNLYPEGELVEYPVGKGVTLNLCDGCIYDLDGAAEEGERIMDMEKETR